jgi:RNA polymerase sigma factor (sigma-70 family)
MIEKRMEGGDENWLRRLRQHAVGSALEAACLELMERSVRQAFAVTHDRDLAEDLAHKALEPIFKDLWANQDLLDDPAALEKRRFLRVRGRVYNWRCSLKTAEVFERKMAIEVELNSEWAEPEIGLQDRAKAQLESALESLPLNERKAILLTHGEGMPLRDAAAALGLPSETVRKQAYRGMKKLREIFGVERLKASSNNILRTLQ